MKSDNTLRPEAGRRVLSFSAGALSFSAGEDVVSCRRVLSFPAGVLPFPAGGALSFSAGGHGAPVLNAGMSVVLCADAECRRAGMSVWGARDAAQAGGCADAVFGRRVCRADKP